MQRRSSAAGSMGPRPRRSSGCAAEVAAVHVRFAFLKAQPFVKPIRRAAIRSRGEIHGPRAEFGSEPKCLLYELRPDAPAACPAVDDNILDPRSGACRNLEQDQCQHADDPFLLGPCDEE